MRIKTKGIIHVKNLKKMKESMRLHYAGMDRLLRLKLSKVTKMM